MTGKLRAGEVVSRDREGLIREDAVETGHATRLLARFGRRYAAVVRLATLLPIAAIAMLRTSDPWAVGLVVAIAVVWTCGCGWLLIHRGSTLLAADAAVLLGLCLSVFWTDAVAETNTGWLRLLVTFACVTWQWHTPLRAGVCATLAVCGGMLAIFAAAGLSMPASYFWVPVAAALSRTTWVLVSRAAARADRMAAEAERSRLAAAVATAARAEEREVVNSLHDTAATTLLMVGAGQVSRDAHWLPRQARSDLGRITDGGAPPRIMGGGAPPTSETDLVERLRADLDVVDLSVDVAAPDRLPLPSGVATALAGATREALNNVRRHAGTDRARVSVEGDSTAVTVDIVDTGSGFRADAGAPAGRRGLRESIHGRMDRIGGRATVTSRPGAGTHVRLVWRADDR